MPALKPSVDAPAWPAPLSRCVNLAQPVTRQGNSLQHPARLQRT